MSHPVKVEIDGDLAWVKIDNPPVNATSTAVRVGLLAAVEQVQGCKLAVLHCAGRTFVAGGDMSEFDAPPVEPHLPDVVNAIEDSATPFVAILHGTVLGGGFEIAMACAYRIAHPGTRFGLPEVNMGLIPGAGGTQRAPRLLGWDMAVDMACLGQLKTADQLLEMGAIDLVTPSPEGEVFAFIGRHFTKTSTRTVDSSFAKNDRIAPIEKFAKGRQGPLHNLEALSWAVEPFANAQPRERALHLGLRNSAESRALRHVFFAERAASKPAALKGAAPAHVKQIAIIGGGLMGAGIATACLNAGMSVTIIEQNTDAAGKAHDTVKGLLRGGLDRGKMTLPQFKSRIASLMTSAHYDDTAMADLAIEAVFEDLEVKRDVFAKLSAAMRPDAILATNTSYLDPNEIFAGISNPDRCLGIHFFSPAHIMKLVEVIKAAHTSPRTLSTGFALAKSLRKTPVLAGVCDGFIGNRILTAYRRAAEYLLADGALPQDIDQAMREFGMAMGPFEAQDQSGLQIALANRRRQDATRDQNERYVPLLDRICAMDRFGRRSGAGWYSYSDGTTPELDPVITELIVAYSAEAGIARTSFAPQEIQETLLTAMANEGARLIDDGIAEDEAAVDVVKTSGYGFPRRRGGPMHWAETQGVDAIRASLSRLNKASPGSWTPALRYQDNASR